ncbi:MAG: FG-GAP repeat domain-containing protein, partial [Thermoleophilaceae bacterium]
MRPRLLLAALVALCLLPAAAYAAQKTETATGGDVAVTLTYNLGRFKVVTGTHIKIARAGAALLDMAVPEPCNQCAVEPAAVFGGGSSLTVRDLDGDGEPEVIFDIYTGGAHCCSYSWIYRYAGTTYSGLAATWGNVGYTLVDLNGDGVPELRSLDDRFAYEFTDYADSSFPPAVWSYRAGKLSDVTRSYPKLATADATRQLRLYRRERKVRDVRGVVAAYVADAYLLNSGPKGLAFLKLAERRGDLDGFGRGD